MSQKLPLSVLKPIIQRVRTDTFAYRVRDEDGSYSKPGRRQRALRDADLRAHLDSGDRAGVYPMMPDSSTTRIAVLDLDDHDHNLTLDEILDTAGDIRDALEMVGLNTINFLSSSGHGVHMFMVWDEPQEAKDVREFISRTLESVGLGTKSGGSLNEGHVEMFPKQNAVGESGFGNQFWLPLSGNSKPLNDSMEILDKQDACYFDWPVSAHVPAISEQESVRSAELLPSEKVEDEQLQEWIHYIPLDNGDDFSYDRWIRTGFGLYNATGGSNEGMKLWVEFSQRGASCDTVDELEYKWNSFGTSDPPGGQIVTPKFLEKLAREGGWVEDASQEFEEETRPANPMPALDRTQSGEILSSTNNLLEILRRPDICGYEVSYDLFGDRTIVREITPQGWTNWRDFMDRDYQCIKAYLESGPLRMKKINRQDLRDCVTTVSGDPERITDIMYVWLMDGVPEWDGVPRIRRFFTDYFGAEDNDYVRNVSLYTWVALAARTLDRDIEADNVPVLVSGEGCGKSTALKEIPPSKEQFAELSLNQKQEDMSRLLRGVTIAEFNEMRGLTEESESYVTGFLSQTRERWVPKFKEFANFYYRRCVFIGTTNYQRFLYPRPGRNQNRRWLPLQIDRADRESIKRDRLQLWAEAREYYRNNGFDHLRPVVEELGVYERPKYTCRDPWMDRILEYISNREEVYGAPEDDITDQGMFISNAEIFESALGVRGRSWASAANKIEMIMHGLGFEESEYVKPDSGVPIKGWVRYGPQKQIAP